MDIILALCIAAVFLCGLVYFVITSGSDKDATTPVSQVLEVEPSATTASTSTQPSASTDQPANAEPYTTCASASRLRVVINIFFAIGCFAAFVIFLMSFVVEKPEYGVPRSNGLGFAHALGTLASTILLWAFGHAIADIADNTARLCHQNENK